MNTSPLSDLADQWRQDADRFRRLGQEAPARMSEAHAEELEAQLRVWEIEPVTLEEAAELSGYSYSHLQHLVADGVITNVGAKHSPRIRRQDVPLKPGRGSAVATSKADALDRTLQIHQARR